MLISQENDRQLLQMCAVINEMRIKHGLTSRQLAEHAAIPENIVVSLENCIVPNEFTVEHLFNLCRFFNLHVSEYFMPKKP